MTIGSQNSRSDVTAAVAGTCIASIEGPAKELGPNEILEHGLANRDVDPGQSFDLCRCQPHAWHLEVLGPDAIEGLTIREVLHGTPMEFRQPC